MPKKTNTFPAQLETLYHMLYWVRTEAAGIGFDLSNLNQLEIAVEEAIVNIIHHAYHDQPGTIQITLEPIPNEEMKVIIIDSGAPFDPLTQGKKIDLEASLEERQIGGLGLLFIQACVDQAIYQRGVNTNILTLIKKLPH